MEWVWMMGTWMVKLLSPNSLDDPALRAGTTDGTLVSPTPVVEDVAPPENVAVVPGKASFSACRSHSQLDDTPDAWAWLNRSAKSGKAILPAEVLEEWNSGGSRRSSLLRSFVSRVYMPGARSTNQHVAIGSMEPHTAGDEGFHENLQGLRVAHGWRNERSLEVEWDTRYFLNHGCFFLAFSVTK